MPQNACQTFGTGDAVLDGGRVLKLLEDRNRLFQRGALFDRIGVSVR